MYTSVVPDFEQSTAQGWTIGDLKQRQRDTRALIILGTQSAEDYKRHGKLELTHPINPRQRFFVAASDVILRTVKDLTCFDWAASGVLNAEDRADFMRKNSLTDESTVSFATLDIVRHMICNFDERGNHTGTIRNLRYKAAMN